MEEEREMKNNTLFNAIIRIDLLKINNMPLILSNLENYMSTNYTFNTTDIRNVNINLEDPEALLTQEMIKTNINTTSNYEYISKDGKGKFVLNEYFLIFEKNKFSDYKKIDEYLSTILEIFNQIIEVEPEIKISRIGIRKMNQLFIDDLEKLKKIINPLKFNLPIDDMKIINEYNVLQKNLDIGNYSSNILISLKKGLSHNEQTQEDKDVYRIVWDIDCYYRNTDKSIIQAKLEELNNKVFGRYKDIITNELFDSLKNDNNPGGTPLQAFGIIGGINKNA